MARRIVSVAALLIGVLVTGRTAAALFASHSGLENGYSIPIVALEFATSAEQVSAAAVELSPKGDGFEAVRKELRLDDRVIIPVYVLLLVAIALAVSPSLSGADRRYAWLLAGLALMTGGFDYTENAALRQVLAAVEDTGTMPNFGALVGAATAKWAGLAACMAAIGAAFLATDRARWAAYPALGTAVIWGLSLAAAPLRPGIEWGFLLFGVALVAVGVVLWRAPRSEPRLAV